ncbi:alpha-hydroxy acid oxidase [Pseudoxanthomonas suwonensis]|uniref:Glycolate oxidase n=1 Tax=Pseudoxanthomonas suwonensis TaxID=314722 RepID=A0A0E3Z0M1_9GAMM|nr:alpha-hydroxy acid oxidase [Pseudoxanthomonas suwonensis]AKC86219.1 glycolate oxidase [Pseudoxanthomonas suwonensis]
MTLPPMASIPARIAAVADYEAEARERMGGAAWAYLSGGAADELTLADNSAAFARLKLQGRVLRPLDGGDTRVTLFGDTFDYPVLLAPVALQTLAHRDGELATVLGASAMRAGMVVSTESGIALEEIARAAQTSLWFQLYLQPDRDFTAALVARAEAAGCRALVLTVDAPVNGVRNREQRAGFALPPGVEAANLRGMPPPAAHRAGAPGGSPLFGSGLLAHAPTWDDVAWLRSITRLPVVLKGVLAAADAEAAVDAGIAGLIVSNHGGRTLDTLPATIDALPAVAAAVAGRIPVLLDGGVRRGSDVLKALALGADAVLVGRPYVYALAAAGAPGVAHVLHLLRAELEVAMALTGCRTLADIGPEVLWSAVRQP